MNRRKGIILAGGSGTRLNPITGYITKQLLPLYDKPMIFYPLSVLMLSGIKDVLIISAPRDLQSFKNLFSDGSDFGIKIEYAIQKKPEGIAQAFLIGKKFIGKSSVTLILGDNIFFGSSFTKKLIDANNKIEGATLFAYPVKNPSRFGVINFDKKNRPLSIIEKPKFPKSNMAVTGLYFYDNSVVRIAENLKPSKRGELEITDINKKFIKKKNIKIEILDRGFYWNDAGTFNSLLEISNVVQSFQKKHNSLISLPEEIAFNNKWINKKQLKKNYLKYKNTEIFNYLKKFT